MPNPSHADRHLLWQYFVDKIMVEYNIPPKSLILDYGLLSRYSKGKILSFSLNLHSLKAQAQHGISSRLLNSGNQRNSTQNDFV